MPTISWRRADGHPLPGKIKINHSIGVLEIPYFRPEDASIYECVAENSRGQNVARGQLLFHSKNHVPFASSFMEVTVTNKVLGISNIKYFIMFYVSFSFFLSFIFSHYDHFNRN